jgi:hypothetical protein
MLKWLGALLFATLTPMFPAAADSSSPLLAAYYDRQMVIIGQVAYGWQGTDHPQRVHDEAVQVGVGRTSYYVLTTAGVLLKFAEASQKSRLVADGVARFAAGRIGVLAILKSGALFVKGLAHRGQYGDGKLKTTDRFVQTASNVAAITAHTGHAILMTKSGDVLGTGGNIYGPVGRHGLGDKAVRWSQDIVGCNGDRDRIVAFAGYTAGRDTYGVGCGLRPGSGRNYERRCRRYGRVVIDHRAQNRRQPVAMGSWGQTACGCSAGRALNADMYRRRLLR